jgi:hypothetical protein
MAVTSAMSASGQINTKVTATSRSATSAAFRLATRNKHRSTRFTKGSKSSSVSDDGWATTSRVGA